MKVLVVIDKLFFCKTQIQKAEEKNETVFSNVHRFVNSFVPELCFPSRDRKSSLLSTTSLLQGRA